MMNLTPYRKDSNIFRLMDDFERSFFNDSVSGLSHFRTDISEKDGAYLLEAELPGFSPEDISLEIEGDTLSISAHHSSKKDEKDKDGNYIRRERRWGSYSRSFDVSNIDADKITADYSNGILSLSMPKKPEQQPATRKIAIGDGNGAKQKSKNRLDAKNDPHNHTGGDYSTAPEEDGSAHPVDKPAH